MAINRISRWEFTQLLQMPFPFATGIREQVEWWTNDAGTIVGTVAREKSEEGWQCVVFRRNGKGGFRVSTLLSGMESQQIASLRLLEVMGAAKSARPPTRVVKRPLSKSSAKTKRRQPWTDERC